METIETVCRDCGSTFLREKKRGRPAVKCVPCREKISTVLQFSKNNGTTKEVTVEVIDGVTWIENAEPCESCDKVFMRPRKRGRPPTKCPDCTAWAEAEKASTMTTSQETLNELFKGDKKLLKGTPDVNPFGAEAQCPTTGKCGRIFTSNSACDEHKKWLPNGSYTCIDPATLGMEPRERRGVPIWTRPSIKED